MIKKINKTEEIKKKLIEEGKVSYIEQTPEEINKWNEEMEELHNESVYKQNMSKIHSRDFWVF